MMFFRTIAIFCCCLMLSTMAGCASSSQKKRTKDDIAIVLESPISLHNYTIAREYASSGRYELAREHYLLAYAAADGMAIRDMLAKELKAVDLMIRSLR